MNKSTIPKVPAKQARFVAEYLVDLNATQAAIRAGYSARTAEQQGCRLLRNAQVASAVTEGKAKQLAQADVSGTRVIEENRRIGLNDVRAFFDPTGHLKPVQEWTPEMAAVVSRIEIMKKPAGAGGHPDEVVKLWFWNKNQALELLAKHLGLLKSKEEEARPHGPVFILPPGTKVAVE
jgi:phage terminase small subunit